MSSFSNTKASTVKYTERIRHNYGQKAVEHGKEYSVQINRASYRGDGIARVKGFIIFVKNAKA
jgi:predicted RNA-binding protein with TRAM domain